MKQSETLKSKFWIMEIVPTSGKILATPLSGDLIKWEVIVVNDRNFRWYYLHGEKEHIGMILITSF